MNYQIAVAMLPVTPIVAVRPRAPGHSAFDTQPLDAGRTFSLPPIAVARPDVTPIRRLRPRAPGQQIVDTHERAAGRTSSPHQIAVARLDVTPTSPMRPRAPGQSEADTPKASAGRTLSRTPGPLRPPSGAIVMEARLTQETEKPTTETASAPVRSEFSLRAGAHNNASENQFAVARTTLTPNLVVRPPRARPLVH